MTYFLHISHSDKGEEDEGREDFSLLKVKQEKQDKKEKKVEEEREEADVEEQEQDEKMEEDKQEGGDITTSEIIRIKQEVQSAEEEEEAPNDAGIK